MEIKDLERPLKDPRGNTIVDDITRKPLKYGEMLYNSVYGEPKDGMDSAARSKANRLGVKIAIVLDKIDNLKTGKEKAEVALIMSAKDIAFLQVLSAFALNTMLFGAIERELENGKLPEEGTEDP